MKTKSLFRRSPLLFALGLAAAPSLFAFSYTSCLFGRVDWGQTAVNFFPSSISFPAGSSPRAALEAAFDAWNLHAPGSQFRFSRVYDNATTITTGDGKPSVGFTNGYNFAGALAVTRTTYNCFFASHLTDADILFNPTYSWDYAAVPSFPVSPYSPYNLTMVAMHEMGHAFGLNHSDSVLATMNAIYPDGGTVGAGNAIQPLSDDVAGDRYLYGTCCAERDVFASLYRPTSPGNSDWIFPPSVSYRGKPFGFLFTLGNRGTQAETVRVDFFLSTDRNITPADTYLGSSTLSLSPAVTSNLSVSFYPGLPLTLASGSYFPGYLVDPLDSIPEVDESNNGAALAISTYVPNFTPPAACFSASPAIGPAPLTVSFDGSCSYDPDGSISSYSWDFGDGFADSGAAVSHNYSFDGSYTARLTVTDNGGNSSETTQLITVTNGSCFAEMKDGKLVPCL